MLVISVLASRLHGIIADILKLKTVYMLGFNRCNKILIYQKRNPHYKFMKICKVYSNAMKFVNLLTESVL